MRLRKRTRLALAAALVVVGGACSIYAPRFQDCAIRCGAQDRCPSGTECRGGFCRQAGATGSCECRAGDERACGGSRGACTPGVQRCLSENTWGSCIGEGRATPEVCDGVDNDCNGEVDDLVAAGAACELSLGVCGNKVRACVDGGFEPVCAAASYGPDYEALETRCDGLDNDCDGRIDGTSPVLLAGPNGAFAWAYQGDRFGAVYALAGTGIWYRSFDSNLSPLSSQVLVAPTQGPVLQLVAAGFGGADGGGLVAVWVEDRDGGAELFGSRVVNGAATPLAPPGNPELAGRVDLALSAAGPLAVWPARGASLVRGALLPAGDGGATSTDFNLLADGGPDGQVIRSVQISPDGQVISWLGFRPADDGGTDAGSDGGSDAGAPFELHVVSLPSRSPSAVLPLPFELTMFDLVSLADGGTPLFFLERTAAIPIFGLTRLRYAADAFDAGSSAALRTTSFGVMEGFSATEQAGSTAAAWVERPRNLYLGTPVGAGARIRQVLDAGLADGGTPLELSLTRGPAGMLGLSWRDAPGPGATASGMLVCPP